MFSITIPLPPGFANRYEKFSIIEILSAIHSSVKEQRFSLKLNYSINNNGNNTNNYYYNNNNNDNNNNSANN